MAKYTCRVEADKTLYPVLLSNGNLISQGDTEVRRFNAFFCLFSKCLLSLAFAESKNFHQNVGWSALCLMGGSIQKTVLSICFGGWTAS